MIRNYIIVLLIVMVLGVGSVCKLQADKIVQLKIDVASWEKAATDAAEREINAHRSCEVTIEELDKLKATFDKADKAEKSTLEKLSEFPNPTPQRPLKNASNANSKPSSAIELDPAYVRLLNEAYCHGAPADIYCRAKADDTKSGSVQSN